MELKTRENFIEKEKIELQTIVVKWEGLFRLPTVLQLIPVSRASWYSGVKKGRFPKPVRLGDNTVAWRASDIKAIIERQGE